MNKEFKYFSYDPVDYEFNYHETLEEAKEKAEYRFLSTIINKDKK